MSTNLEKLLALETNLETAASSGNTIAGAFASHLLLVTGAMKELAAATPLAPVPAVDLSGYVSTGDFKALTGVLSQMQSVVSTLSQRVTLIENAISLMSQGPEQPQPLVPVPATGDIKAAV